MPTIWLTLTGFLVTVALVTADDNSISKEIVENAPIEETESKVEKNCEMTNYDDFLKCIEKNNGFRDKRQTTIKRFTQDQVEYCKNLRLRCLTNCNGDKLCETECPICPTLLPVQSGYGDEALDILAPVYPEPGKPVINRRIIVEGANGTYQQYEAEIDADRKITTIIRLTNIINNTNIIDIPTNINNTNVNHIHIHQNQTGGDFGLGETKEGSCCFAVRPKSCRKSTSGVRCHHKRQKVCGRQCTARTIHLQTRKRCQGGNCQRRTAYIPQPQPKCYHVDYWPYVNCGETRYQQRSCEGCYDHYGYGYEQYYGQGAPNCYGCYDDGFNYGQMYRRGPVMQPSYYHQPPCYITGTCYDQSYSYRDDRVDPVWGGYASNDYMYDDEPRDYVNDYPVVDRPMNVFPDEDYEYNITPSKKEDDQETDWGVPVQKCKVISDDGTVTIKNCSVEDDEDFNPYAVAPKSYPYYEPVDYLGQRDNRRRRPHPRPIYYDGNQPRQQRPHHRRVRPNPYMDPNDIDMADDEPPLDMDMDNNVESFEE